MYTTLSPCDMCTGACVLYKLARVVIGENHNFVGGEAYLKQKGIEVVVLDSAECKALMTNFIREHSATWYVYELICTVYCNNSICVMTGMKILGCERWMFDTLQRFVIGHHQSYIPYEHTSSLCHMNMVDMKSSLVR